MIDVESQSLAPAKVYVWSRVLAAAALWTSIIPAAWSSVRNGWDLALVWWLPTVVAAIPLCVPGRKPFRVAALTAAVLLSVLSVPGLLFGWFLHLPAALILVAAAQADPLQRTPRLSRLAIAVGLTVAMVTTAGWAVEIYRMALAPPDTFTVHTSSRFDPMEPPFRRIIEADGSGIGSGADHVSFTGSDDGTGPVLAVGFPKDLSGAEQDRLRQHLLELPEVTDVRLCPRLQPWC
ncbi:hypothetical protein [Micromonospora sp. MA102]|uniref:hypothetical protein n=1 Tax=Micromonospora sp. MA102 TaxID=2952755 RepID=UPI0021C7E5DF|nr:hypothetical protein [Micromonospora sp. MA102]